MKFLRLSPLRLQAAGALLVGLLVIWGFAAYLTDRAEQSALSAGAERSQLLARTFAEHTRATVRLIDLAAIQLADAWSRGPSQFEAQVERTRANLGDIALQVGAADGDGMVTYSDLGLPPAPVSLRDREHIRVHLDSDEDRLFISRPVQGRVSKKWSIQFTRPIQRAGRNVGVMVLSVDPGYFRRFYQSVTLGEDDIVAIVRGSGELMARVPGPQDYLGTVIKNAPYLGANAPDQGSYRRAGQTDGVVRTYGYARLVDAGLVVVAGLSDATTLSGYHAQRNWTVAAASGLSLALLLAIMLVLWPLEARERKALERAQSSEESFQILVEGVTDYAIIRLDPNGLVSQWNAGAQRINGYTAKDIVGRHFSCFYTPGDIAAGKPAEALRIAREQGRYEETGLRVRQSGEQFWAEVITTALRDSDGRLSGFAKVTRDISERKKAEEERHSAEEQLREAQKLESIGQLTGGLAHDFNNLLGIVVGNLDMIADQLPDDERTRRQHHAALDAALRGAEVTRSLLAVARRQPLEVRPYELNALISEMLPLLRASAGSSVALECRLDGERLTAMVDAGGLSQVVLNLVNNARDAMADATGDRKLTIRTYAQRIGQGEHVQLSPGHYAVLEVSDSGVGMSEFVRAQAFEPFFTTKERGRGTGLGLAMVYGYATQLGGTASIESTPGAGTSVRIHLPLQASAVIAGSEAGTAAASVANDAVASPSLGRVLVVDDEESLCELACDWLESLGYTVRGVHSPARALELLATEQFDALFTDVVMPGGMDGVALAREALKRQPQLQVLITSGYAQGLTEDPDLPGPVLSKPYRKQQLGHALQQLFAGGDIRQPWSASTI